MHQPSFQQPQAVKLIRDDGTEAGISADKFIAVNRDASDHASRLSRNTKAVDLDSFPGLQKYFALSEIITHLDYLLIDGSIRFKAGEVRSYFLNK